MTPGGTSCTTNDTSNFGDTQVEALVLSCFGLNLDLTLLYKAEVNEDGPTVESGSFAGSYDTTFSNTPTDPSDALIDYISGAAIACPECILLVKDGNQSPAQYLFNIGSWNGTEDLNLQGFWPNNGAISNVAIWGAPPTRQVAEPATLALLGLGLLTAAAMRRRRTR